jgi:hypothetical protein
MNHSTLTTTIAVLKSTLKKESIGLRDKTAKIEETRSKKLKNNQV